MKTLKSILTISFLGLLIGFSSCGGDDQKLPCLDCSAVGFPICVGYTDPDTGITVTQSSLKSSKAFFESLGLDCNFSED